MTEMPTSPREGCAGGISVNNLDPTKALPTKGRRTGAKQIGCWSMLFVKIGPPVNVTRRCGGMLWGTLVVGGGVILQAFTRPSVSSRWRKDQPGTERGEGFNSFHSMGWRYLQEFDGGGKGGNGEGVEKSVMWWSKSSRLVQGRCLTYCHTTESLTQVGVYTTISSETWPRVRV